MSIQDEMDKIADQVANDFFTRAPQYRTKIMLRKTVKAAIKPKLEIGDWLADELTAALDALSVHVYPEYDLVDERRAVSAWRLPNDR